MLIQHPTRCKNFHSKTDELWKCSLGNSLVMKNLVQKLFAIPVFFSDPFCERKHETAIFGVLKHLVQKLFSIPVSYLIFILIKEALNCLLWSFCRVISRVNFFFRNEFCKRIFFLKTEFYLETWCFENIWIQHLTRWKNFHSEIDDLWKCWLDDAFVMKNLVQKLFAIPFLPLRFILWTKTQNCLFWRFFRCKKLQMLIFREQSLLQNLICKKKLSLKSDAM